ncbi:hypothetical protein BJX96DRAFT_153904 [Aspergillus floccosus]
MCKHVHALWDKARFALRPIQTTSTVVEVQFYWLPANEKKKLDARNKPGIGMYRESAMGCKLFNVRTEKVITSGEVIRITTPDPEKLPLPSYELLELQWFLHRVAALSGAADVDDSDDDSDDDDDDYASRCGVEWEPEEEFEVVARHDVEPAQCFTTRLVPANSPRVQQENQPLTLQLPT